MVTQVLVVMDAGQVRVYLNGTIKCTEDRQDRARFDGVTVYAADPFYPVANVRRTRHC